MRVTRREHGPRYRYRIVYGSTFADTPVVDVATSIAGRDRVDDIGLFGRDTHDAEMGPYGDSDVLEHAPVLLHLTVIHRHTGIVNGLVHHAKRIRLRHPAEVVQRSGPIALTGGIYLIDGDDFAWLRLLQQVVVMKAPPGRGIAPKALALIRGVGAWSWLHIQDTHLEDVARLSPCDGHRARADMYP